ncbi:MAG: site-specific integrase [Sideroxydans sp.]
MQIRKKGHSTVTKTFKIKSDAIKWASIIESEIERGVFIDRSEAEGTTIRQAFDRYLSEVSPLKKGFSREKTMITRWQAYKLADRSMATVKSAEIASWRDARLTEVSPSSVNRELSLLSHLFTVAAKDWGMGNTNPVLLVRKPRPNKGRDRRLNQLEIDKIISATESFELPIIVRLLTETAMRRGELNKLRWEHIDFKNKTALLVDTKNNEDRTIPLSSRAISALQTLPRRIDGQVIGMSVDAITRAFARACKRAKVDDARIHDLRHEGVSRLFERGLDLMEVSAVSGHKTLSQLKRYTHLKAEDIARKLG